MGGKKRNNQKGGQVLGWGESVPAQKKEETKQEMMYQPKPSGQPKRQVMEDPFGGSLDDLYDGPKKKQPAQRPPQQPGVDGLGHPLQGKAKPVKQPPPGKERQDAAFSIEDELAARPSKGRGKRGPAQPQKNPQEHTVGHREAAGSGYGRGDDYGRQPGGYGRPTASSHGSYGFSLGYGQPPHGHPPPGYNQGYSQGSGQMCSQNQGYGYNQGYADGYGGRGYAQGKNPNQHYDQGYGKSSQGPRQGGGPNKPQQHQGYEPKEMQPASEQQKDKPQKKQKKPTVKAEPFEKTEDAAFLSFVETNLDESSQIDKELKEKLLAHHADNWVDLRPLHKYLRNSVIFKEDSVESTQLENALIQTAIAAKEKQIELTDAGTAYLEERSKEVMTNCITKQVNAVDSPEGKLAQKDAKLADTLFQPSQTFEGDFDWKEEDESLPEAAPDFQSILELVGEEQDPFGEVREQLDEADPVSAETLYNGLAMMKIRTDDEKKDATRELQVNPDILANRALEKERLTQQTIEKEEKELRVNRLRRQQELQERLESAALDNQRDQVAKPDEEKKPKDKSDEDSEDQIPQAAPKVAKKPQVKKPEKKAEDSEDEESEDELELVMKKPAQKKTIPPKKAPVSKPTVKKAPVEEKKGSSSDEDSEDEVALLMTKKKQAPKPLPSKKEKKEESSEEATSSDEDEIELIMGSAPAPKAKALPTQFNLAHTVKQEQEIAFSIQPQETKAELYSKEREEARKAGPSPHLSKPVEEVKEGEVYAIEDKTAVTDFDSLLPPASRAVQYPFELDTFQKRAVFRLEQGANVFVAAHTSAGKTVVAEYAIALAFKHMTKAIYTAPIKALSNQKFRDFKQKYEDVGVVTGDVTINRDASCVIMTTEVLQQICFLDNDYLQDVEWVILDEVHYVNDTERGHVWEEVIVKLPEHIGLVMLSATFSNYLEFAEWVGRTRNRKVYVQCTFQRPVPLEHQMILNQKLVTVKQGEKGLDTEAVKQILTQSKDHFYKQQKAAGGGGQGAGRGGGGKNRIDYKGKAIASQQAGIGKQIDKAMGQGGGGGPNSQKNKKNDEFFKNLKEVKRLNLLPCIVFFFSRAQVEQLAEEADQHVNFISDSERKSVKDFIKKALQRIDERDRDLPQVLKLCKLLVRGIGFHHAGMIPLLKEMVEILFTDGLLHVVFATSTFAIGLNMPARSVMFAEAKKFSREAKGKSIMQAMEYMQMAGRAGRRGKDDKGASIINVDRGLGAVPSAAEFETMFDVAGEDVESKFKVTYKTNLNHSEGDDVGSLIQSSFFANNDQQKKIEALRVKAKLEKSMDTMTDIECHYGVSEQARKVNSAMQKILKLNKDIMWESGLRPIPWHVAILSTATHLFKPVIVLGTVSAKQDSLAGGSSEIHFRCLALQPAKDYAVQVRYEEEEDYDTLLQRELRNQENPRGALRGMSGTEQGFHYHYMTVPQSEFMKFFRNECKLDYPLRLNSSQLSHKDLVSVINWFKSEASGGRSLDEITPKKGATVKRLYADREALIMDLMQAKCFGCEKLVYHLTQLEHEQKLKSAMQDVKKLISADSNKMESEFMAKNKVLMHYEMIDKEENLLSKGKVAKQIQSSGVELILIVQLFFSGKLKSINDKEMLALFSVLQELQAGGQNQVMESKISDNFWDVCIWLEQQAIKLIEVENKCGVQDQEQDPTKRLNYYFYEIIYDWASKKSFMEIKQSFPHMEEGLIIKMVLNVKSMCSHVKKMAIQIGDMNMSERMDKAAELLDREIMSTQSLYFSQ